MTAKQFITETLAKLAVQFPDVTIKYAFNHSIETYVVEFTPTEAYYNNKLLDAAWIPFSMEFEQLFLYDNIAFISSDSILSISQPEIVWNQKTIAIQNLLLEQYGIKVQSVLSENITVYTFPTGTQVMQAISVSPLSTYGLGIGNQVTLENNMAFTNYSAKPSSKKDYTMAA
ncbi:MAG: hypothetical protein EAY72_10170 [Bacteroidetes bacterium]|nr:MAG: hypothetical protein EAY72_10170 [Bacteroidota bacterium]